MNRLISIAVASLLGGCIIFSSQQSTLAEERNLVPASVAQGKTGETPTISVSPYGIVISFEDLKESIQKYWATDDTYLRVGTNAPLGTEANLLFLKTEGKWSDNNNGTGVTVQTKDKSGESRTYSFLIEFKKDKPKYSIIRIYPDSGSTPIVTSKIAETVVPRAIETVPKITDASNLLKGALPQSVSAPNAPSIANATNPLKSVLSGIGSQSIRSVASNAPPSISQQQSSSEPEPTVPQQNVSKDNNVSLPQSSQEPIKPEDSAEKIIPTSMIIPTSIKTSATQPSTSRKNPSALIFAHSQANALVRGVLVATRTKELNPRGAVATKVQYVIRRLRRGQDLVSSAKKESVELKVINRLLELGNYRDPS
jgi:hypothetical protein